jgi:hypothetical protein
MWESDEGVRARRRDSIQGQRDPGRVTEDPTVAKQILPTRAGFFFGNTEYDERYLNDVRMTHAWAIRMLYELKWAM